MEVLLADLLPCPICEIVPELYQRCRDTGGAAHSRRNNHLPRLLGGSPPAPTRAVDQAIQGEHTNEEAFSH